MDRASDYREKAANYQVAMIRIEILAEHLGDLAVTATPDANMLDAFAGAILALATQAQKENEI
jgi:hypothetical protein